MKLINLFYSTFLSVERLARNDSNKPVSPNCPILPYHKKTNNFHIVSNKHIASYFTEFFMVWNWFCGCFSTTKVEIHIPVRSNTFSVDASLWTVWNTCGALDSVAGFARTLVGSDASSLAASPFTVIATFVCLRI